MFLLFNKIVVYQFNNHDFKWALELENKVSLACQLYIQPEWDKRDEMIPKIVEFVDRIISNIEDEATIEQVGKEVNEMMKDFKLFAY